MSTWVYSIGNVATNAFVIWSHPQSGLTQSKTAKSVINNFASVSGEYQNAQILHGGNLVLILHFALELVIWVDNDNKSLQIWKNVIPYVVNCKNVILFLYIENPIKMISPKSLAKGYYYLQWLEIFKKTNTCHLCEEREFWINCFSISKIAGVSKQHHVTILKY